MPKVNGGKELGHELGIKVFVEGNDPLDVQLLTPLQSIPKVRQVLLHVSEIDRLDLHIQVLILLKDIVVDGLQKLALKWTPVRTPTQCHTDLACNTSYHFAASRTVFPRVPPYLARDRLRFWLTYMIVPLASI